MQLRVGKIRICFGKHKRVKRAAEGCQNKDMLWEHKRVKRAAETPSKEEYALRSTKRLSVQLRGLPK